MGEVSETARLVQMIDRLFDCLNATNLISRRCKRKSIQVYFTIPGVKYFLSERISQDPMENSFGCQRQRGGANKNPNVAQFCKNTQALRVINSVRETVSKSNRER